MRIVLAVIFVACSVSPVFAQVNLTGSWQPKYWILKMSLQQEGDRVWGYGGAQDYWFRGYWDGPRLIIVANNFDPKRPKSACRPRGVMAIAGKAVSSLTTTWWDEGREKPLGGTWTRLSPNAGDSVAYPYAAELTQCGSLRISTRGWGSEQAVADNATDDGRALNRQVEIVLN